MKNPGIEGLGLAWLKLIKANYLNGLVTSKLWALRFPAGSKRIRTASLLHVGKMNESCDGG